MTWTPAGGCFGFGELETLPLSASDLNIFGYLNPVTCPSVSHAPLISEGPVGTSQSALLVLPTTGADPPPVNLSILFNNWPYASSPTPPHPADAERLFQALW